MTPAELGAAVRSVVAAAVSAGELDVEVPAEVTVERPRVKEHGDYATSIALQLAKGAGRRPREVAELLAARLRTVEGVAEVDVAGPGFLNLRLAQDALGEVVRTVVRQGPAYGRGDAAAGQSVNLEFVSANPTGPIHLGGVRWAAVGDALARLLEASGAKVTREYYFNDHGAQIDRFARSLLAAATGQPAPEDGYGGDYIGEIAQAVLNDVPDALQQADPQEVFRAHGVQRMFEEIKQSLSDFGVEFDVYFHENSLHESGAVQKAVDRLKAAGRMYEQDGALWLRTTDLGDDKDRVVVKSDGEPAYISGDLAYYLDKRERGFDRCVIMLGADHSGYVGRLMAMCAAFGDVPGENLEILIGQLVNLLRDGEPLRMSKRAGTVVTLEDLVDAVGVDAGRYALVRSSTDSQIDIDLDLWSRKTSDNPVFYVQYAAVRAASVLRNAGDLGITLDDDADLSLLTHPREAELLLALAEFPAVVAQAAELREPHRVARYLEEKVAKSAQRFWDDCQVLPKGDEEVAPDHPAAAAPVAGHADRARERPGAARGLRPGAHVSTGRRTAQVLPGRPTPQVRASADLDPVVWPASARRNDAGALELGGVDVRDLAREFGTPAFVLDEADFRARARAWAQAFEGGDVYYAAKAFLCTAVARWVAEEGLSLDVCTGGELAVALRAGFPVERLLFHGNNKSVAELERAVEARVGRIVVDSPEELARLAAVAAGRGVRQAVYLRITPGVEAHTHEYISTGQEDSKFGFGLDSGAAAKAVAEVLAQPSLELRGLHCHIGSHIFDDRGFAEAAHRMVGLLALVRDEHGVELPELDLGGGQGIAYTAADDPMPVERHAADLRGIVARECAARGLAVPRLAVEPGRAIAGPTTVTLYEVGTVKELPGVRTYVSVDGGMSDNVRTALYDAEYTAVLAGRGPGADRRTVTVSGKHCESGDIVVREVDLPADVAPGDLLAVPASGAYHRSMASNYNHVPRPPVVAVRDGRARVVVRRETEDDLLRLDVDPEESP